MKLEVNSTVFPIAINENNIFPNNTQWFLSGRSALKAIIAESEFDSIAIPIWCCDSIIIPFIEKGIHVEFYNNEMPNTSAVLVMDFFGYSIDKDWSNYPGIVIRDLTHSIFSKKHDDADYYFGSLRKWAGFWTGGFAWGFKDKVCFSEDEFDYVALRKSAMEEKEMYISSTYTEAINKEIKKSYLNKFHDAETLLEELPILPASNRDVEYALHLDVRKIKNQRRKNANVLLKYLSDLAFFPELKSEDCPMFVPIRVNNRDLLRRHLIDCDIYCPVHWPISELHRLNDEIKCLYDTELSLICDQRYNEHDMMRIVLAIQNFQEMSDIDVVSL